MKRTTQPAQRRLISLAAAAEQLDVCPRTIRRYISAGRLTAYRIGPRLIKIDAHEIDLLPVVFGRIS
ncbi:helix-turn-helix domain-containing protein [Mycobacteroides abscessus subsp. abscessus]|uniref:helix-turn-helix transcriptional regulator n=1 Tax=Mycobacteroides abscessus TaxID=36809 RepID=UPI0019D0C064|nr:helix-turn-helix domain-containing protein [Mycobacteroides abscessus]MBN7435739.1 helix-turn-helix domain-containing protein [Mycobacteroides abscessus subsp. abscessus]